MTVFKIYIDKLIIKPGNSLAALSKRRRTIIRRARKFRSQSARIEEDDITTYFTVPKYVAGEGSEKENDDNLVISDQQSETIRSHDSDSIDDSDGPRHDSSDGLENNYKRISEEFQVEHDDLMKDSHGIVVPLLLSANPDNPRYITPNDCTGDFVAHRTYISNINRGPFMGCPFNTLKSNHMLSIKYNRFAEGQLKLFVVFEKLKKHSEDGQVHYQNWIDIEVVMRLEPKWLLFDYLSFHYLHARRSWAHIKRQANKQKIDLSRYITSECRKAYSDYDERRRKGQIYRRMIDK